MSIEISDEVIAICVQNAALATKGIYGFSGGLTDNISKNLFGITPAYKGIKVSQTEEGVNVDVSVIVDYKVKIPDVAWNLQEQVKKEIEDITGLAVTAVNIHVAGVHFVDKEQSR